MVYFLRLSIADYLAILEKAIGAKLLPRSFPSTVMLPAMFHCNVLISDTALSLNFVTECKAVVSNIKAERDICRHL